jgi:hypothetical protein
MFLKIRHDDDFSLVEILDLRELFDPFAAQVAGRLHGGEDMQDPQAYAKTDLPLRRGPAPLLAGSPLPGLSLRPDAAQAAGAWSAKGARLPIPTGSRVLR